MRRFGARDGGGEPLTRLRRRLGLVHSELRRPVDRVQRLVALVLLVLLLATAPPMAVWAAGWSHDAGLRAERAERESRHQVVATVVETKQKASDPYLSESVKAKWTDPDGKARTGTLPNWKGAEDGARRRIWVDGSGDPTVRPRPHSRTVTDAAYAGAAGAAAAGLPLLLGYALLRRRCDHHRAALWEAEWARMDADAGRNRPN